MITADVLWATVELIVASLVPTTILVAVALIADDVTDRTRISAVLFALAVMALALWLL